MTGEPIKNTIFYITILTVIILLFSWFTHISCDYPYYFIWDMDHITSLDTVLIHSELLPDHNNHPSFGMYLTLFFSEKIAHFFDTLSVLNLKDIAGSLNPLAAMAELTTFIRLHSPFLVIGIVLLLCMAIYLMFGMSRWYLFLFLAILGTQESLTYHSSMVRSELYSVFFWSCAILALAMAVKATGTFSRILSLLATGLLLGLSFLTKIQAFFYLAALLFLLLLIFSIYQDYEKQDRLALTRKSAIWIVAVSLFNVIAFLILGIFSYSTSIPSGAHTRASAFCITPMAALFFLALLSLFLAQLFLYQTNKASSQTFMFSSFFSIIALGFILSFLSHFFLYSDVGVSMHYMLINFKMMFLRQSAVIPDLSANIPKFSLEGLLLNLHHNPTLFIVIIALNLLLVLGYYFQFVRITKGQLVLCLLITALAFVNIVVGTRYNLRDILWKEVLINLLNLFYFAILITRATRYRRIVATVGSSLLIILFCANCIHVLDMPKRIDANYNCYGWQEHRWFRNAYRNNQRKYRDIILKKYNNTTARIAKIFAVDQEKIRRKVEFVFKNQTITHRNIGIVFEGFPAWCKDSGYKIIEVPSAIKGSILVDNSSIRLKKKTFFKKKYVRARSEYLDKFTKPSSVKKLSILTRHDLRIFLFVHADDVSHLLSKQIVKTPHKILLRKTGQSIELQGLEIKKYCEIPLDKIIKKFFFVIQKV